MIAGSSKPSDVVIHINSERNSGCSSCCTEIISVPVVRPALSLHLMSEGGVVQLEILAEKDLKSSAMTILSAYLSSGVRALGTE